MEGSVFEWFLHHNYQVSLTTLASYEAKIAEICNPWTFGPVTYSSLILKLDTYFIAKNMFHFLFYLPMGKFPLMHLREKHIAKGFGGL